MLTVYRVPSPDIDGIDFFKVYSRSENRWIQFTTKEYDDASSPYENVSEAMADLFPEDEYEEVLSRHKSPITDEFATVYDKKTLRSLKRGVKSRKDVFAEALLPIAVDDGDESTIRTQYLKSRKPSSLNQPTTQNQLDDFFNEYTFKEFLSEEEFAEVIAIEQIGARIQSRGDATPENLEYLKTVPGIAEALGLDFDEVDESLKALDEIASISEELSEQISDEAVLDSYEMDETRIAPSTEKEVKIQELANRGILIDNAIISHISTISDALNANTEIFQYSSDATVDLEDALLGTVDNIGLLKALDVLEKHSVSLTPAQYQVVEQEIDISQVSAVDEISNLITNTTNTLTVNNYYIAQSKLRNIKQKIALQHFKLDTGDERYKTLSFIDNFMGSQHSSFFALFLKEIEHSIQIAFARSPSTIQINASKKLTDSLISFLDRIFNIYEKNGLEIKNFEYLSAYNNALKIKSEWLEVRGTSTKSYAELLQDNDWMYKWAISASSIILFVIVDELNALKTGELNLNSHISNIDADTAAVVNNMISNEARKELAELQKTFDMEDVFRVTVPPKRDTNKFVNSKFDVSSFIFKNGETPLRLRNVERDYKGEILKLTSQDIHDNLHSLTMNVLEPLSSYGFKFDILEGLKYVNFDDKIKPGNSDHYYGCAVDISSGNAIEDRIIYEYILENLDFNKLYLTNYYSILSDTYLHISYYRQNMAWEKLIGLRDYKIVR